MNQLALNFAGYDTPNQCGVYADCEVIKLDSQRKGWRGCASAEIRIANTPYGFDWGISLYFSKGGCGYMPSESNLKWRRFAQTREEALQGAKQEMLDRIASDDAFGGGKDIPAVRKWVQQVTA